MEIFFTKRTKDVVQKLSWMKLKWTKIKSIEELIKKKVRMKYLKQCLLVDTEAEKEEIMALNTYKGFNVPNEDPYFICVSSEEIRLEESGDVVGLPSKRGCSPQQLFDGVYRSEG